MGAFRWMMGLGTLNMTLEKLQPRLGKSAGCLPPCGYEYSVSASLLTSGKP